MSHNKYVHDNVIPFRATTRRKEKNTNDRHYRAENTKRKEKREQQREHTYVVRNKEKL